ncbi:MAG: hypothetical protein ABL911_12725 [Gallionella sp.]
MNFILGRPTVVQVVWIFLFITEVIVGGLPIEHALKIELSVVGGMLLGFLMAIRLSFFQRNVAVKEAINSNMAETQKLIRDSLNRSIYQPILGRNAQGNEMSSKANFDLADNIKSFISILLCFSLSMMLWYEPLLLEFSFSSLVSPLTLIKQIALQAFYVLLISTAFAGICLNLSDIFFKGELK